MWAVGLLERLMSLETWSTPRWGRPMMNVSALDLTGRFSAGRGRRFIFVGSEWGSVGSFPPQSPHFYQHLMVLVSSGGGVRNGVHLPAFFGVCFLSA